ncbi:MAG TPA: hypothetical protein VNI82_00270 [Candidatus Nitrosotenuis sp.]|nr:hypothetical protein [Candidatus Nitrosotenuis sp.]
MKLLDICALKSYFKGIMTDIDRKEAHDAHMERLAQRRQTFVGDLGVLALATVDLNLFSPSTPESTPPKPKHSQEIGTAALMSTVCIPPVERATPTHLGYADQYPLAA